jgi:hypothetical protein
MAYETYQKAKAFSQRPSDVAVLPDDVNDVGRFIFDRGIWAFGEHVNSAVESAGSGTRNPTIARSQRIREWSRLMGEDMETSAAGFAAPSGEAMSKHGKVIGDLDDQPVDAGTVLKSGY